MPLDILLLDRISIFPTIRLNFRLSFSQNSERLKHAGSVRNRIATGSNSRHLFQYVSRLLFEAKFACNVKKRARVPGLIRG